MSRSIHILTLVAMGMMIMDNLDVENLARSCAEKNQWEFMFTVAPLRLKRGTGSAINAIAVLSLTQEGTLMTTTSAAPVEDVSKVPIIGPRIVRNVPRLPDTVVERFRAFTVPEVSDAVGPLYTLDPAIKAAYSPIAPIVGLALTAKAPPGDNLTIHGALGMAQAGDVLVVDWRGYTGGGGTGSHSLTAPMHRGLVGVIIDGAIRDIQETREMLLPIFARGVCAYSTAKARPGEVINVPVSCGGVDVHPGDVVIADEEGVAVVPREYAATVAEALEAKRREPKVVKLRLKPSSP